MENFKKHAMSFEEVTHKIARLDRLQKKGDVFTVTFQSGKRRRRER